MRYGVGCKRENWQQVLSALQPYFNVPADMHARASCLNLSAQSSVLCQSRELRTGRTRIPYYGAMSNLSNSKKATAFPMAGQQTCAVVAGGGGNG